ncbi:MAG: aldo/keto reductase [Planctomycetota bacterium]
MEPRDFGKRSGLRVAPVSLGAMRLPKDTLEAVRLIRHAIDAGLRYIDTSRGYDDSEYKLALALRDGYRERVILSTKWSPWNLRVQPGDDASADAVRRRIEEQLARLQVEHLDFYQVWNVDSVEHLDEITAPAGTVDGIRRAMREGLVKHTGMTVHMKPEEIIPRLSALDWCEAILCSFHMANRRYRPVLEAAHKLGIATIVMNPMGGGSLTQPSPVLARLAGEMGVASVPDLAIRYVLSQPCIDTLLCGAEKPADVDDTVASAERGPFSAEALGRLEAFLDGLLPQNVRFCTECGYCLPCPQGIDIPDLMSLIYKERFWGFGQTARRSYQRLSGPKADACVACGECEARCTQKLPIAEEMAYAARVLGGKT